MILGLSTSAFTTLHVIISIVGLAAGIVVAVAMVKGRPTPGWTLVFLLTTLFTSVSGFFFKATMLLPSHITGIVSLIVLIPAFIALYVFHMRGAWRWIYVVGAVTALYLNAFVAVVQAFQKIPALKPLAPTQSEPPFLVAQLVVLALFVWIGVAAVRRFRPPGVGVTA